MFGSNGETVAVRKQYHFWPGDEGLDAWDVDRLIDLSASLEVEEVPVTAISEVDTTYWFHEAEQATVRKVIEHVRLIEEVDPAYPIILGPDGRVMDGMHEDIEAGPQPRNAGRRCGCGCVEVPDALAAQVEYFADEPLLFHTGHRRMFPDIRAAVGRVIDVATLRWIGFGQIVGSPAFVGQHPRSFERRCGNTSKRAEARPVADSDDGRDDSIPVGVRVRSGHPRAPARRGNRAVHCHRCGTSPS